MKYRDLVTEVTGALDVPWGDGPTKSGLPVRTLAVLAAIRRLKHSDELERTDGHFQQQEQR